MYSRMGALHMHRSASEGYLRNSLPGRESSLHSHDTGSGELRGPSTSGMQEEMSYRHNIVQDQPRGYLAARMNETPDFAMIYAFLGSMFDPVSLPPNHVFTCSSECHIANCSREDFSERSSEEVELA